jgi:hypothetical protein
MATATLPTAYSMIKSQPMIHAMISPTSRTRTYAEPEMGTIDANSA